MTRPNLVVAVADLEREEQLSRDWELSVDWLDRALAGTGALPSDAPGRFRAKLSKNGREILVQGRIQATVTLPCARTLDPAVYALSPELVLILHKKDEPRRAGAEAKGGGARPTSTKKGSKPREEPLLTEEDAASDTYSGETILLDDFVREQLLLELPMFPLRSDLRSNESPAMPAPPRPGFGDAIDPRLLPLQAIRDKLKTGK